MATTKSATNFVQVTLIKFKFSLDSKNVPETWARPCQGMTVTGVSSVAVRLPLHDVGTELTRLMTKVTVSARMALKSARFHVVNLNI